MFWAVGSASPEGTDRTAPNPSRGSTPPLRDARNAVLSTPSGAHGWRLCKAPRRDLFVTQIVGESLNRRLPNGTVCLFRLGPQGSRNGQIVLAEHHAISNPDLGGRYTVKVYRSEKRTRPDGSWEHLSLDLLPDSTNPKYQPIVADPASAPALRTVAAFVRIPE